MASVNHFGLFSRAFSLCEVDSSTSPIAYNNIYMPLADVVAVYWRVKKWNFSLSAQWAEVNSSVATWQFEKTGEFTVGEYVSEIEGLDVYNGSYRTGSAAEIETELVCGMKEGVITEIGDESLFETPVTGHFIYNTVASDLDASGGTAAESSKTGINYKIQMPYGGPPAIYNGELFSPPITFEFNTARWNASAIEYPSALGSYGNFNLSILGKVYSCSIFASNSRSNRPEFTNTFSINADLEAIEYWEYDPNDGNGPKYDSVTGAILRTDI